MYFLQYKKRAADGNGLGQRYSDGAKDIPRPASMFLKLKKTPQPVSAILLRKEVGHRARAYIVDR